MIGAIIMGNQTNKRQQRIVNKTFSILLNDNHSTLTLKITKLFAFKGSNNNAVSKSFSCYFTVDLSRASKFHRTEIFNSVLSTTVDVVCSFAGYDRCSVSYTSIISYTSRNTTTLALTMYYQHQPVTHTFWPIYEELSVHTRGSQNPLSIV